MASLISSLTRALAILFIAGQLVAIAARAADPISATEAVRHVGEKAEVCGIVASTNYATRSRGQPTFLNIDHPYPNHIFTALIWGSDRARFDYAPETLKGRRICVRGVITVYRGKPQIIVSGPSQLRRVK